MCPSASARWCPTPDQLMILEEMYKAGVRTPSASQIQKITAHLSLYGRIEGKNVFYWFQNHKARDRQKLRRKLAKQLHLQHQKLFQPHFPVSGFLHGSYSPDLSPSSTSLQHLANYYSNPPNPSTASYIPQGENLMTMHNYWKSCNYEMDRERNRTMMKMYSGGWMMVEEEMESPVFRATRRPVKTLELFPTTCTNLKEDPKISAVLPP